MLVRIAAISLSRCSTSTSARASFSMLSRIAGSRLAISSRARSMSNGSGTASLALRRDLVEGRPHVARGMRAENQEQRPGTQRRPDQPLLDH